MKSINYILFLCILFLNTSCGTILRLQKDGDLKKAINISITNSNKDIKVFQNGKELKYKIVYDGSDKSSPFVVRRYYLDLAPNELQLEIENKNGRQKVNVSKTRDKANFWIQGLWIFIDYASGALNYYQDLAIEE